MSIWSQIELRKKLPLIDDDVLNKAVALLSEPEDHLPPAAFNEPVQSVGVIRLEEDELASWQQKQKPAFQKRSIQIIQRGDDEVRRRWEQNLQVLRKLRSEIRSAKADCTRQMRDKDGVRGADDKLWSELFKLEKHVVRSLEKYAYRLTVLAEELEYLNQTGEVRKVGPSPAKRSLESVGAKRVMIAGKKLVEDGREANTYGELFALLEEEGVVLTDSGYRDSLKNVFLHGESVYVPASKAGVRDKFEETKERIIEFYKRHRSH